MRSPRSRNRVRRRLIRLPDGRDLDVLVGAGAATQGLVFCFGSPGGAIVWRPAVDAAAARNLRYVSIARPGSGRSTRQPDRTVADFARDLEAVARRLQLADLFVVGWSAGGPPALAAAALLHGLVRAAALVASPAPHREDGVNLRAELGEERYERLIAGSELAERAAAGAATFPLTTARARRSMAASASPADAALAAGSTPSVLAAQLREGFRSGNWGWHDDMRSQVRDWGFDTDAIPIPVHVWHGEEDPIVAIAHGRWLAQHVGPGPHHLLANEGHASIMVNHLDEIFDELTR